MEVTRSAAGASAGAGTRRRFTGLDIARGAAMAFLTSPRAARVTPIAHPSRRRRCSLERLGELDAARDHAEMSEIVQRRASSYRACIARRRHDLSIDCLAEEIAQVP